jgi:hypothetical protein
MNNIKPLRRKDWSPIITQQRVNWEELEKVMVVGKTKDGDIKIYTSAMETFDGAALSTYLMQYIHRAIEYGYE